MCRSGSPCNLRGEPLPFTGAENASRDFTYVDDIVDALLRAGYVQEAVGQEMNIASGTETRILEMAELVVAYKGRGGVGFDLAGAEYDYPAKDHHDAFALVRRNKTGTIARFARGGADEPVFPHPP